MSWIRTASGKKFHYDDPEANIIDIADIAEHLSKIPRFSGACRPNLSVAQHSVHVASLMLRDNGTPTEGMLGLLHDAHEAFMGGDIPTPASDYLYEVTGHDMKALLVEPIDAVIFAKFKLPHPLPEKMEAKLKRCDKAALVAEGVQLVRGFIPDPTWPTMDLSVRPMSEDQARRSFMELFTKLRTMREKAGQWR